MTERMNRGVVIGFEDQTHAIPKGAKTLKGPQDLVGFEVDAPPVGATDLIGEELIPTKRVDVVQ